jgi:hypothetical protein
MDDRIKTKIEQASEPVPNRGLSASSSSFSQTKFVLKNLSVVRVRVGAFVNK